MELTPMDHKFLEPRHTHMECNTDFALMKKPKRHVQYSYIPIEWNKAIKETCKTFCHANDIGRFLYLL